MSGDACREEGGAFGHFFLTGPTEVRPEVLEAQIGAMIGHRGVEIRRLMRELQIGLRELFQTVRPVFISTSSATGLMEAAIRNGVRSRVLCLVNGAFSYRFAQIARACAFEVDTLDVPWGRHHDPDDVRRTLVEGGYDAVTIVHSETSTGVLNPLEGIASVVRSFDDTLLLVDSVSGVGGTELLTDRWALDFVLTGSQKALALPPGIAFGVASSGMMERSAEAVGKGFYFDLLSFGDQADRFQTPTTPPISLLFALREQLKAIAFEGLVARWRRHQEMADRCATWVKRVAAEGRARVSILAAPGYRSPTVTCIRLPGGVDGSAVVRRMAERGFVIGGGYGRLKESTIRIGHMGDHTPEDVDVLLESLEEAIVHA